MNAPVPRTGWPSLFKLAFGRSANPMLLMDQGRVILAANSAHESFAGFRSEELVGRQVDAVIPPDEHERLQHHWEALQRTGALAGDISGLDAQGGRLQIQFAACRAFLGGREVVLSVLLNTELRPMSLSRSPRQPREPLTPRELEVVSEIAMGKRTHEVAEALFIEPTTVRSHVRNAMARLGARSQAQLVAITLATGALDAERLQKILDADA